MRDQQRTVGAAVQFAALAALLLWAGPSRAQQVTPTITLDPPAPRAGQPFSITVHATGTLEFVFSDGFQRQGNNLAFTLYHVVVTCPPVPVPQEKTYAAGPFAAGDYTVSVWDPNFTSLLGSASFRVAEVAAVPTLGSWGLILLCLALATAAATRLRQRRAASS